MTKQEAKELFGSVAELAAAIGITPQAVYLWPDPLTDKIRDRVIAAALRTGRMTPPAATEQSAEVAA